MTFTSKYLNTITGNSETPLRNTDYFVFPSGTDREEIIDTLEAYCKANNFSRARTYEAIGEVLNGNCFQEHYHRYEATGQTVQLSMSAIEVEF